MQPSFELKVTVKPEDLDDLHHVNNVVYLQWVQDVAKAHWAVLSNEHINKKYAWVVLRHEIDYHRSARLNDELTLRTWVGETSGFRSVRHVDITGPDGAKIAAARTTWCLIDAATFKPARINDEILHCLLPS
jgi:acyl-CoA thioester hydrolase